jgi:hypothetical protein
VSTSRSTGADEQRTCPSARCEEGSLLIGVVGSDGLVGYLRPALPVDADFVRIAAEGREAEQRLRFASPCVEGSCRHWTGRQCGLIDSTLEAAEERELPGPDRLVRPTRGRGLRRLPARHDRASGALAVKGRTTLGGDQVGRLHQPIGPPTNPPLTANQHGGNADRFCPLHVGDRIVAHHPHLRW